MAKRASSHRTLEQQGLPCIDLHAENGVQFRHMYQRLATPRLKHSFFLFGARGTGKSTYLKTLFKNEKTFWFDLLDDALAQELLAHPHKFEEKILAIKNLSKIWIVVDEIQRVPTLLNYVHRLIEIHNIKFALTGSSARKLKRGGANLLAGRALNNFMHPLTVTELKNDFQLNTVLNWGTLPAIFDKFFDEEDSVARADYLRSYVANYVRQEILEEQIIRKIEPFLHFLEVAAQCNGKVINFSKIGRDSHNDSKNVERYYQILKDTLLGFELMPFHLSIRKRQSQKSKFYLFDLGVKKALDLTLNTHLQEGTSAFGHAFEHFFILECIRLNDYFRKDYRFSYLLTKDDVEIDLIVERPGKKILCIEIKSSKKIDASEFGPVVKLTQELKNCELVVACREKHSRKLESFSILPWQDVLKLLFGANLFEDTNPIK